MKIVCIGRNYADHAAELNNAVPSEPVIFIKPDSALLRNNLPFYIPEFSKDVHHEIELVLKICKTGKSVPEQFAGDYYSEIGLGIDFTARDLQDELKKKGLPWEKAKGFDHSALIGKFLPVGKFEKGPINFHLTKNGTVVQKGISSDMLFSFDRIIAEVSKYFMLKIGDYIYTGTPAGVSAVAPGDRLEGFLEDERMFFCNVK